MTIVGANARNTIIDADGSNAADRVLKILGNPIDVSISHVTIQNGKSSLDGGGILT